ncbi:MAG: hypothetical protein ACK4S0_02270 [Sediminibacterium sp.]
MNQHLPKLCILLMIINLSSCTNNSRKSYPPKFGDNGKVVDSIKIAYKAEGIEFENLEKTDLTDTSLTICLINCKKQISNNFDSSLIELKAIASNIRRSLANDSAYKSYRIVFVNREKGIVTTEFFSYEADIPLSDLKD